VSLATAIQMLEDGWPREPFPDRTIALYGERLGRYPEELVLRAVDDLVGTATFRPSVGQVMERVAERALNLPTAEEAWEIAERGTLRDAPEAVREAAEYVGGRWAILHSDNPTTVRAQFRTAYSGVRRQAVEDWITGGRPQLAGTTPLELGPTMKALPVTERIRPRPIMSRLIERWGGRDPGPPTEEEKHDAILVLADPPNADDPKDDPLYAEAERVFAESSSGPSS
jgi:hypothetical protein